jgi:hypothetical protein
MNVSSMNSEVMWYIAIGHMFQYLTNVISSTSKGETLIPYSVYRCPTLKWLVLLLQVQKV